jgi:hypothetical protein
MGDAVTNHIFPCCERKNVRRTARLPWNWHKNPPEMAVNLRFSGNHGIIGTGGALGSLSIFVLNCASTLFVFREQRAVFHKMDAPFEMRIRI